MLKKLLGSVCSLVLLLLAFAPSETLAQGSLTPLNDDFTNPTTLASWRRVYAEEGWGADQLESLDIGRTRSDWLTMVPRSSVWYQDWRGELTFKPVQGDFVVTTRVHVSSRSGSGTPQSSFSLAGVMARVPNAQRSLWQPGHENYVFLSLGSADLPGTLQYEAKNTVDSDSRYQTSPSGTSEAYLQIARVGSVFILLAKAPNQPWVVMGRYDRPDMPAQLQVGMTCYTDWDTCSALVPYTHNSTSITWGTPDLIAQYHYMRFERPVLPSALQGVDLTDSSAAPDDALRGFLGDAATW